MPSIFSELTFFLKYHTEDSKSTILHAAEKISNIFHILIDIYPFLLMAYNVQIQESISNILNHVSN